MNYTPTMTHYHIVPQVSTKNSIDFSTIEIRLNGLLEAEVAQVDADANSLGLAAISEVLWPIV